MRNVDLRPSRPGLVRIEQGMRDLATAIHELLARPAPAPKPPAALERPRTATGQPQPRANPKAPARTTPRRGSLQGTSQSMPLLSVFQFLGRMRKSGTLHVRMRKEELAFVLEQGCIAFATSNQLVAEERLGDLLVDAEACTRNQVEVMQAMANVISSDLFGQQAIESGIATHEQVLQAIEAQVRLRFTRCCKGSDASYEFVEGEQNAPQPMFRCQPIAVT